MAEIEWKILNEGRAWRGEEAWERYEKYTPEKLEMIDGKLLWSDEDREGRPVLIVASPPPPAWSRTAPAGPP